MSIFETALQFEQIFFSIKYGLFPILLIQNFPPR